MSTQASLPFTPAASIKHLKAFELDGTLYLRVIPGKKLFQSTMVHDVVNRGDIFAVRLEDSMLTIIPGTAKVTHVDLSLVTNNDYT